jgi:pyrroline-5-carboxylate reductase
MMKDTQLAFIGGGNMAASLIGGLVADNLNPNQITVSDSDERQREALAVSFGVHTGTDNVAVVAAADVVVLAVKPQILKAVSEELAATVQECRPLVVSVAAGVRSDDIERWLGGNVAVVRAMPNTPALVQSGATALYANAGVSPEQRDQAESILRAAGLTLWVAEEAAMDAVTALSGSGPAYFFRIMEAMENAATSLGLPAETAHLLTLQTALGAAKMALESSDPVSVLRERVTSPGGTTEQGLRVLAENHIDEVMAQVLQAAYERSRELATLLGEEKG